jgi:D-glycero-alpha-D-manno-heptose 1-phosphate guanylyltransferase
MTVEAIILAGGLGTRLRPAVSDRPKPMAQIGDVPFLELLLNSLQLKGVTRVILSVGYLKEWILDFFGAEYNGMQIDYFEEEHPLGTGGAIRNSLAKVNGEFAIVLNGDTFVDFEMNKLLTEYLSSRSPVILTRRVDDTSRFGKIEVTGDRVSSFGAAASSGPGMINAGVYLLPKNLFTDSNLKDPFSFESDFLVDAVERITFKAVETEGVFIDIGTPADFKKAQDYFGAL